MYSLVYVTLAIQKDYAVPKPLFDRAFVKVKLSRSSFALTSLFYMICHSIDMVMITQFANYQKLQVFIISSAS